MDILEAYQILGVPLNATEEQIKSAYKQKSLEWHPDRLFLQRPDLNPVRQKPDQTAKQKQQLEENIAKEKALFEGKFKEIKNAFDLITKKLAKNKLRPAKQQNAENQTRQKSKADTFFKSQQGSPKNGKIDPYEVNKTRVYKVAQLLNDPKSAASKAFQNFSIDKRYLLFLGNALDVAVSGAYRNLKRPILSKNVYFNRTQKVFSDVQDNQSVTDDRKLFTNLFSITGLYVFDVPIILLDQKSVKTKFFVSPPKQDGRVVENALQIYDLKATCQYLDPLGFAYTEIQSQAEHKNKTSFEQLLIAVSEIKDFSTYKPIGYSLTELDEPEKQQQFCRFFQNAYQLEIPSCQQPKFFAYLRTCVLLDELKNAIKDDKTHSPDDKKVAQDKIVHLKTNLDTQVIKSKLTGSTDPNFLTQCKAQVRDIANQFCNTRITVVCAKIAVVVAFIFTLGLIKLSTLPSTLWNKSSVLENKAHTVEAVDEPIQTLTR